ncbi:MAG: hypothetical protein R3C52_12445 [Hyphomonadaceae bacterium]
MNQKLRIMSFAGAAVAALSFGLAVSVAPAVADVAGEAPAKAKRPDLTGFWTNASLTPLSRARGVSDLVVDEETAKKIAASTAVAGISSEDPDFNDTGYSDPNKGAPEKGGSDFGLKGYDKFWVTPGDNLAKVKGEYRTSYIVDPPNGQIPFTAAAKPVLAERAKGGVRYVTGIGGNAGPEDTNISERCLIGFGQTGGPGMLSVLYNNTHQIVQSPGYVTIVVEMAHDARIVPIFDTAEEARANHKPSAIKPWLGDSVGWYEDNALVIETRNVNPQQQAAGAFPMTDKTVVTERLTRYSPDEIFYTFTVEDPVLYSQPWKAELSFYPAQGRQFEYACHEGNYAMPGMLLGERLKEWETQEAKAKK